MLSYILPLQTVRFVALNVLRCQGIFLILQTVRFVALNVLRCQGIFLILQTVRFKSYLLSLGIPDPVTRETHGTGSNYFHELARQISRAMEQPLKV